jgi:hypothetical protein
VRREIILRYFEHELGVTFDERIRAMKAIGEQLLEVVRRLLSPLKPDKDWLTKYVKEVPKSIPALKVFTCGQYTWVHASGTFCTSLGHLMRDVVLPVVSFDTPFVKTSGAVSRSASYVELLLKTAFPGGNVTLNNVATSLEWNIRVLNFALCKSLKAPSTYRMPTKTNKTAVDNETSDHDCDCPSDAGTDDVDDDSGDYSDDSGDYSGDDCSDDHSSGLSVKRQRSNQAVKSQLSPAHLRMAQETRDSKLSGVKVLKDAAKALLHRAFPLLQGVSPNSVLECPVTQTAIALYGPASTYQAPTRPTNSPDQQEAQPAPVPSDCRSWTAEQPV